VVRLTDCGFGEKREKKNLRNVWVRIFRLPTPPPCKKKAGKVGGPATRNPTNIKRFGSVKKEK